MHFTYHKYMCISWQRFLEVFHYPSFSFRPNLLRCGDELTAFLLLAIREFLVVLRVLFLTFALHVVSHVKSRRSLI